MAIDSNIWARRALALALACSSILAAAPSRAGGDAYVSVRPGDTLISITHRYLDRVDRWPALKTLNHIPNEYHLPPGSRLRLPAKWLRWDKGEAEVVHVMGKVAGPHGPLAIGMKLTEGDSVDTCAEGILTLKLRNGATVVFPPGTRARLGILEQIDGAPLERAVIDLEEGSAESRVPSLKASGSRFDVRTPHVVTAVRGTHFRVTAAADGESSRHEVIQGVVRVDGDKSRATLDPGQGLVAEAGKVGKPLALPAAPDVSQLPTRIERTVARLSAPATPGVAGWHWRLATDAQFIHLIQDQRVTTSSWLLAGEPDGDYYLGLRAIDADGLESDDAVRVIAVRARPEPPLMLHPAPDALLAGPVRLKWAEAKGAAATHLQVARDAEFKDVIADRADLGQREFALAADLPPGDYWWRLASRRADGYQGPIGDAARFSVLAPTKMTPPDLAADGLHVAWSGPADLRYRVQMADDAGFTASVSETEVAGVHATLPKPGSGVHFVRTQPLLPDGSAGPWSDAQRFEVPGHKPWWLLVLLVPFL